MKETQLDIILAVFRRITFNLMVLFGGKLSVHHVCFAWCWSVGVCTHYLQLEVVPEARCTVHPEQNGMFLLGAEPKGKSVRSGAGTLIRGPRVNHHTSITAKDVSSASWQQKERNEMHWMPVYIS